MLSFEKCTKQQEQKTEQCGHVAFITYRYADSKATQLMDSTITYQTDTCGQQFLDWKLVSTRPAKVLTPHCVNGETLWYEKYIVKISE